MKSLNLLKVDRKCVQIKKQAKNNLGLKILAKVIPKSGYYFINEYSNVLKYDFF